MGYPAQVVAITGDGPHQPISIMAMLPLPQFQWITQFPASVWPIDIVVLGNKDFDYALLVDSIVKGHPGTRVIWQEAFIDLILQGRDAWHDKKEMIRAARNRQAIFAAKCLVHALEAPFRWPTHDHVDRSIAGWNAQLRPVSLLRQKGYRFDLPPDVRRGAIAVTIAVFADPAVGVRSVASVLKFLQRREDVSDSARDTWREDLEWLAQYARQFSSGVEWPT